MARMYTTEHIGIAVHSLEKSLPLFEALLDTACYKTERVEHEGVNTAFLRAGSTKVELLEACHDEGPVARFLRQRGEGLHHIAFEVGDIRAEMARLAAAGFELLQEEPREGADNKLVCFLHPKSTGGVLVELCQDRGSAGADAPGAD